MTNGFDPADRTTTLPRGTPAPGRERMPAAGAPDNRVVAAVRLGWLMAELYGPALDREVRPGPHLPTEPELGHDERMSLALHQVDHLLGALRLPAPRRQNDSGFDVADLLVSRSEEPLNAPAGFRERLRQLHVAILDRATLADPRLRAGYELGRALGDTCLTPDAGSGATFFLAQFNRYRVASIKGFLAQVADALPLGVAAAVLGSLDQWQRWAQVAGPELSGDWDDRQRWVIAALRTQGQLWFGALTGGWQPDVAASPDALHAATQAGLHDAGTLGARVLGRFWPFSFAVLAGLGGLLYVSLADPTGAARAWAFLVALLVAFAVLGGGLWLTTERLLSLAGRPVQPAARQAALAVTLTSLPAFPDGRYSFTALLRDYRLRRGGVLPPRATAVLDRAAAGPARPRPVPPPVASPATAEHVAAEAVDPPTEPVAGIDDLLDEPDPAQPGSLDTTVAFERPVADQDD